MFSNPLDLHWDNILLNDLVIHKCNFKGDVKINIKSHQIISITQLFIATDLQYSNDPYLLQFPCGLEKLNEDKYIVTYGEADIKCKMFMIKKEKIDIIKILIIINLIFFIIY